MRNILRTYLAPYPLARRVMWIVLLGSTLFTFITAAAQVFFDYYREMDQLQVRLERIRVIDVPSLSNSAWHFDQEQIETQLQGMLNLSDIRYVEIRLTEGTVYSAGSMPPPDAVLSQMATLEYSQNGRVFSLGQLLVVADRQSLLQRVLGLLSRNLIFSAIQIFLLTGFILMVVEWWLARPLNEIVHYAETLDLNHLETPLVLQRRRLAPSGDELELVALKLNEMRSRLQEDMALRQDMAAALQDSERNYREIFNATSEAIFIHEVTNGRILQVNAPMLRLYGYATEAEVVGSTVKSLSDEKPPYSQVEAEQYFNKAILEGPQIFEWLARKKTGETFWVEVSLRSSSIGGMDRILAVVRDITERKQVQSLLRAQNEALIEQRHALEEAEAQTRQLNAELEKRVKERTQQLAALNQELEAFSYSVAHDLRAPLRHMIGFSQVILEDYGSQLDADIRGWLLRISDSGLKMMQMVDALLQLSRVTRDELHVMPVDLSAMAQSVVDDLRAREPERQVDLVIAAGLMTQADPHLLRIMLENLLGNAWKFTGRCHPGRIELGCLPPQPAGFDEENGLTYFVRDNGAGFDMSFADRLFGPFQRLHSDSEFSGTGIGLATVKRVVQRHGGRVWAESSVNRGATFYFKMP